MKSRSHSKYLPGLILGCILLAGCARNPAQREARFLEEGKKHLAAKDFARAAIDFQNAIQAMPGDAEPHYQLALAYLGSGGSQAGVNELFQAAQLDPKHVGAQLKLAELMMIDPNLNVVKAGQKRARDILAQDPDNPDALQALAITELRLEDSTEAVQHLEQALQKVPRHLNSSVTLALIKLRNNDVAGAEEVMRKAAAEAPQSPEHAVALGRLYMTVHKSPEAEKQLLHALELDPANGPALMALGNFLFREGRKDEAEQAFRRVSALPDKQYRPLHAIYLLETGRGDQALTEFAEQYKNEPQNREARTRLVSAYARLGRTADATRVLTDALRANPKDSDALKQRGEMNLAAHKYQEAQAYLTEVRKYHADSAEAHLVLSRIHRARNAAASQIHELTEALRLNPRLLVARAELAYAFTVGNSPKAAIQLLAEAPAGDQQNLLLIVERNAALYALEDYAALRKGIDQGLAISRHPALLLQDGLLHLKDGDYRGSRAPLEEALKSSPQDWRAVRALALSYVGEKKTAEATALVREYTSRPPDSAAGEQFLGSWLTNAGDFPGARAAYQKAKAMNPDSMDSDFGLAQIALAEGKFDSAEDQFNSILSREPRNITALINLGDLEQRTGHSAEAMVSYERALQEDASNIGALNNLAYLLADSGKNPDRALALATKAKELAPENPAVDDTIGWAYYNKGLFQASLDYLGKAAANGTPRRKTHLAMAYFKAGQRQKAMATLQAALKEDPSLPEAQKALELLTRAR